MKKKTFSFVGEEVSYLTTDAFGQLGTGERIKAYLIVKEGNRALVFHPKMEQDDCSSWEFCVYLAKEKAWISEDKGVYINAND